MSSPQEQQPWRTILIVIGLVRRGDELLMVLQEEPYSKTPVWLLPGGKVEDGELLDAALAREVQEETGLRVLRADKLVYVLHIVRPQRAVQAFTFVYDVEEWAGETITDDPSGEILDLEWVPLPEAIRRLETLPVDAVSRAAADYLAGRQPAGVTWLFEDDGNAKGTLRLLTGQPDPPHYITASPTV